MKTDLIYGVGVVGTISGKLIDVYNPKPEEMDLDDILVSLSNICRFSGNCKYFSVLQHSLIMSELCDNSYEKIHALFHDTEEFLLNDTVRPLKYIPEIYNILKPIAEGVFKAISIKFEIDNIDKTPYLQYLDKQLAMYESALLRKFPLSEKADLFVNLKEYYSRFGYIFRMSKKRQIELFKNIYKENMKNYVKKDN